MIKKYRVVQPLIVVFSLAALLFFFSRQSGAARQTLAGFNATSNHQLSVAPPVIGRQMWLYNPALNTGALDTQGFTYSTFLAPNAVASFDATDRVTVLDTTAAQGESAGYAALGAVSLDRTMGYTLRFVAQLVSESHSSEDRAGFSVIALGNDKVGLEVAFWEDEVWVQEGGSAPDLFTHAEGAPFDTTGSQANSQSGPLTLYELRVMDDTYSLAAVQVPLGSVAVRESHILSGTLRDYTAFTGFPDVYESANFLFFGDNTSRGQAAVKIGGISAIVAEAPASRTITAGVSLNIDDIGIIVQTTNELTVTFSTIEGSLTLNTSIPGGVTASSVIREGGPVILADASALNTTLAQPGGLTYQSPATFSGLDTITVTVEQAGQIVEQAIQVTVLGASATPTATRSPVPPATSTATATPIVTATSAPGSVQLPVPQPLYLPLVVQ